MKRDLLVLIFVLVLASTSKSQDFDETIRYLNDNIQPTIRDGALIYKKKVIFYEEGITWIHMEGTSSGRDHSYVKWSQIENVGITSTGKVFVNYVLAQNPTLWDIRYSLYVTPLNEVSPDLLASYIKNATELSGNPIPYPIQEMQDADSEYKRQESIKAEQLSQSIEEIDLFLSLFGSSWEFSGAIFDVGLDQYSYGPEYDPIDKYSFMDARLRFVYGKKRFRLRMDPLSFSWIYLPSYSKYNQKGEFFMRGNFGTTRFYSPGIGFSYVIFPKKELNNPFRNFEIPVSVHYSILSAPNSEDLEINNAIYDSDVYEYFGSGNSRIQASIHINGFIGRIGFGVGFGVNYLNVKASENLLTETVNNNQRRFTYKFDDINKFSPFVDFNLILRKF